MVVGTAIDSASALQSATQSLNNNNVQRQNNNETPDSSAQPFNVEVEAKRNIVNEAAVKQSSPSAIVELSVEATNAAALKAPDVDEVVSSSNSQNSEIAKEVANASENVVDIARAIEAFQAADGLVVAAEKSVEEEQVEVKTQDGAPRSADVIEGATQAFTEIDISV